MSRYTPGRFTASLKKTKISQSNDGQVAGYSDVDARQQLGMHTCTDYEILRYFAMEGGDVHSSLERELPVFLMHGSVAWMRLDRDRHAAPEQRWSKPGRQDSAGDLTVLLANMIES